MDERETAETKRFGRSGFYDFYRVGQFNGSGPEHIMFRFYRPDRSFGSCQCVEESEAAKTCDAIRAMGYEPISHARFIDAREATQ